MSFVLLLGEITGGEKVGEVYVRGDEYHKDGKNLLIFKGETDPYNLTYEELFNHINQKGVYTVKEIKGEFFVIYYNDNSKKIYVANDRLGREALFYFYDGENFILSDDFWEIINLIEPSASGIDIQSVKEKAVFHHPLFNKTIVRNLNYFPPANIGEFSLEDHSFKMTQYWDFRYKPDENLSIDEAISSFDRCLDDTMRGIKEKNPPNTTYGVGLSGGLDSRLIPHYALKHNMNLKSFIIGEKRPHKFILSNDHSNAKKLAKYFNLQHIEVEYDSESFESKSFYDLRYFPMGPSQFFISVRDKVPPFDVLLTGASGILIGCDIPNNIMQLSKEELLDLIMRFSFMNTYERRNIVTRALKVIFNKSPSQRIKRKAIDGIISEDEFAEVKFKIKKFIEDNSDKSNIDIFQKYDIFHRGAKNKYGAFESLIGWKKSYTIYYPYLLEETLTWKPEFLVNRRLLKCLLIKKFPELAKIGAQDYKPAIFYRNKRIGVLRRILASAAFIIRGGGLKQYADWSLDKRYQEYSHRILSKDSKIFRSIFDIEKVIKLGKEDMQLYGDLVKIKEVLDLIESKGYKEFFKPN